MERRGRKAGAAMEEERIEGGARRGGGDWPVPGLPDKVCRKQATGRLYLLQLAVRIARACGP